MFELQSLSFPSFKTLKKNDFEEENFEIKFMLHFRSIRQYAKQKKNNLQSNNLKSV